MTALASIRGALHDGAPYTWITLAFAAAATLWAVVAAALAIRARYRPRPLSDFAAPIVLSLCALVAAAAGIARGRAIMAANALGAVPDSATVADAKATSFAHGVMLQFNAGALGLEVALPLLLILAAGMAFSAMRRARHLDRSPLPPLLVTFAVAWPLVSLIRVPLEHLLALIRTFSGVAGVDPSLKIKLTLVAMTRAHEVLSVGRTAFVITALLAGAALVTAGVIRARERVVAGTAALAPSAAFLVIAAAAFGLTRAHAWDAAHPLSESVGMTNVTPADLARVPVAATCADAVIAEKVAIERDGYVVNGQRLDADGVGDALRTLRNNFRLLHPDLPPPPDGAMILADGATPIDRVRPLLALPLGDSERRWIVLLQQPHTDDTRTLGRLDRPSPCAFRIIVDDAAPSVAQYRDWAALADAVQRAGGPLRVAP